MSYTKATRHRLKAAARLKEHPETKFELIDLQSVTYKPQWMTRAFRNNRYTIMINDFTETTKGNAIRAMIQSHDDRPITNHWSEMQRIKNEIFGTEVTAVEYYPSESAKTDDHNIYWMWVFPSDVLPIPLQPKVRIVPTQLQVRNIASDKQKIEGKYLIGTLAYHQLGEISREPDLFRADGETKDYWVGMWVTGFGFFDVLFPKDTSRELTDEEKEKYNKMSVQIGSQPPLKLKV
jgi:hypothetical protein